MNVSIVVPGKWHVLDLAAELYKRQALAQVITSYPWYKLKKAGIPRQYMSSVFLKEIIARGGSMVQEKFPALFPNIHFEDIGFKYFTHTALRKLKNADIVNITSGCGIDFFTAVKERGAKIVMEVGNTHARNYYTVLANEAKKQGLPFDQPRADFLIKNHEAEYALTDYIAIPSQQVKRTFLRNGIPEEKLLVIPYGVSLQAFSPAPKSDTTFRILFAGMLTLRKGVHHLLQAFAELQLKNAELVLIGTPYPDVQPFLEKYKGMYTHYSAVPRAHLAKLYTTGSVFILPSLEEGLAKVLFEAMASGLPLICTEETGGGDIITHGQEGFVYTAGDNTLLKKYILELYNAPDRAISMGQAALLKARTALSLHDYGEAVYREYTRILSH